MKGKIQYVFELIKQAERVSEKFLKHLSGTNGLYETRIEYQSSRKLRKCHIESILLGYTALEYQCRESNHLLIGDALNTPQKPSLLSLRHFGAKKIHAL